MSGTIDFADFLTFIVFVGIMALSPHVCSHALVQSFLKTLLFLKCFVLYLVQNWSKIYYMFETKSTLEISSGSPCMYSKKGD
jgi:hypothetical protein